MARKSSGNFFTVKEAAEFLGVSTVTMYRYIKRRRSRGGKNRSVLEDSSKAINETDWSR